MSKHKTTPSTVEAIIRADGLTPTARLVLIFLSDLPPHDREQDARAIEQRTGLSHPTVTTALKQLVESEMVYRGLAPHTMLAKPSVVFSSLSTLGIPMGKPLNVLTRMTEPTGGWHQTNDYQELI
jgi:DNA-binding transcriptional ArsR family regulator